MEGRRLRDLPRARRGLVAERGGRIVNLDLTIVCEAPRIGPHVAAMQAGHRRACGIAPSRDRDQGNHQRAARVYRPGGRPVAMATASIELPRRTDDASTEGIAAAPRRSSHSLMAASKIDRHRRELHRRPDRRRADRRSRLSEAVYGGFVTYANEAKIAHDRRAAHD